MERTFFVVGLSVLNTVVKSMVNSLVHVHDPNITAQDRIKFRAKLKIAIILLGKLKYPSTSMCNRSPC